MKKRVSWFVTLAVIAAAGLLAGFGAAPLAAEEGWCCKDGAVFAATPAQCKEKGGTWFVTQIEADRYCKQAPPPGWCCKDGVVVVAEAEECKMKGGIWFATQAEAERYCRSGQKLPDLVIKDIMLNRSCQVVVTVANAGPGMVPDAVWTAHTPTSCSVYIFINGRKWGGKTVWGFDPGKLLQSVGGAARYVSDLIISAEAEITAVIDLTAEVAEIHEDNNKMVKKVKCASEVKPLR